MNKYIRGSSMRLWHVNLKDIVIRHFKISSPFVNIHYYDTIKYSLAPILNIGPINTNLAIFR